MFETYYGYMNTVEDALLLLEACRTGKLKQITKRLNDDERKKIKSGSVFVYEETKSGIVRWTDGFHWSQSKVKNSIYIYHEWSCRRRASGKQTGDPTFYSSSNASRFHDASLDFFDPSNSSQQEYTPSRRHPHPNLSLHSSRPEYYGPESTDSGRVFELSNPMYPHRITSNPGTRSRYNQERFDDYDTPLPYPATNALNSRPTYHHNYRAHEVIQGSYENKELFPHPPIQAIESKHRFLSNENSQDSWGYANEHGGERMLSFRKLPTSAIQKKRGYQKVGGLLKNCYSVETTDNRRMHVVSYYTLEDLNMGLLKAPTNNPNFPIQNIDFDIYPKEVLESLKKNPNNDEDFVYSDSPYNNSISFSSNIGSSSRKRTYDPDSSISSYQDPDQNRDPNSDPNRNRNDLDEYSRVNKNLHISAITNTDNQQDLPGPSSRLTPGFDSEKYKFGQITSLQQGKIHKIHKSNTARVISDCRRDIESFNFFPKNDSVINQDPVQKMQSTDQKRRELYQHHEIMVSKNYDPYSENRHRTPNLNSKLVFSPEQNSSEPPHMKSNTEQNSYGASYDSGRNRDSSYNYEYEPENLHHHGQSGARGYQIIKEPNQDFHPRYSNRSIRSVSTGFKEPLNLYQSPISGPRSSFTFHYSSSKMAPTQLDFQHQESQSLHHNSSKNNDNNQSLQYSSNFHELEPHRSSNLACRTASPVRDPNYKYNYNYSFSHSQYSQKYHHDSAPPEFRRNNHRIDQSPELTPFVKSSNYYYDQKKPSGLYSKEKKGLSPSSSSAHAPELGLNFPITSNLISAIKPDGHRRYPLHSLNHNMVRRDPFRNFSQPQQQSHYSFYEKSKANDMTMDPGYKGSYGQNTYLYKAQNKHQTHGKQINYSEPTHFGSNQNSAYGKPRPGDVGSGSDGGENENEHKNKDQNDIINEDGNKAEDINTGESAIENRVFLENRDDTVGHPLDFQSVQHDAHEKRIQTQVQTQKGYENKDTSSVNQMARPNPKTSDRNDTVLSKPRTSTLTHNSEYTANAPKDDSPSNNPEKYSHTKKPYPFIKLKDEQLKSQVLNQRQGQHRFKDHSTSKDSFCNPITDVNTSPASTISGKESDFNQDKKGSSPFKLGHFEETQSRNRSNSDYLPLKLQPLNTPLPLPVSVKLPVPAQLISKKSCQELGSKSKKTTTAKVIRKEDDDKVKDSCEILPHQYELTDTRVPGEYEYPPPGTKSSFIATPSKGTSKAFSISNLAQAQAQTQFRAQTHHTDSDSPSSIDISKSVALESQHKSAE